MVKKFSFVYQTNNITDQTCNQNYQMNIMIQIYLHKYYLILSFILNKIVGNYHNIK